MPSPYIITRHRTHYLRLRVPTDLAPLLGTHLTRTLGTQDRREALAAAATLAGAAPGWWCMLRASAMASLRGIPLADLTPDDLTRWAREDRAALTADMDRLTPDDRRRLRDHLASLCAAGAAEVREGRHRVEALRLGLEIHASGRERGMLQALEAYGRGAGSAPAVQTTPPAAPAPSAPLPEADPRRALPLSRLAPDYYAHRGQGESSRISHDQAIRDFEAVVGNRGIGTITAADVARYADWLRQQPGRSGRESASVATITKSLGHIRGILKWAAEDAAILDESPGARVRPPREGRRGAAEPRRLPFDTHTLARIFGSPMYTGCQRGRYAEPGPCIAPADRRYFLLAMLLTGARTEELPGATLRELDGGIVCLDLTETARKTAAGARLVPILPALRRTGFLAWARERLASGGTLFRGEGCPADWAQWSGRYLGALGVTDQLHTPYSLRHNFRIMLREANLNSDVANKVFGHESEGAGRHYGRVLLTAKEAAVVAREVRPTVDLSHLYLRGP